MLKIHWLLKVFENSQHPRPASQAPTVSPVLLLVSQLEALNRREMSRRGSHGVLGEIARFNSNLILAARLPSTTNRLQFHTQLL